MLAKYATDDLKQTAFSHEMFKGKVFQKWEKITCPIVEQLSHKQKNRLIKNVLRFCFLYHELSQLTHWDGYGIL